MHIERFINELMSSNCYLIVDEASSCCICIDPASEKSEREIEYIDSNDLTLDFILLTHEHTDHTWGVNTLIARYPSVKVVCSELCKQALPKETNVYFQFYYDNQSYTYSVERVDITIEKLDKQLEWASHRIKFISTPGHTPGSICIAIDDVLFGGDTLMPFKPFIKKRSGGSMEQFQESVKKMSDTFPANTVVYPGHGDKGALCDIVAAINV